MSYTPEEFPIEFECVECGAETAVSYGDVNRVPKDWTAPDAAEVTLISRGWREMSEGHYCPDCTDDLPNPLKD